MIILLESYRSGDRIIDLYIYTQSIYTEYQQQTSNLVSILSLFDYYSVLSYLTPDYLAQQIDPIPVRIICIIWYCVSCIYVHSLSFYLSTNRPTAYIWWCTTYIYFKMLFFYLMVQHMWWNHVWNHQTIKIPVNDYVAINGQ